MENNTNDQQKVVQEIYDHAAQLMVNEERSADDTKKVLMERGVDEPFADMIVSKLEQEIYDAKKEAANKDMLYGALWCVGGIIGTISGIGLIFWGAIIFGAIQFGKGVLNSSNL